MTQLQFSLRSRKKLNVFRISARPTTLNKMHAEIIKLFSNTKFVGNSCRDALNLHTVAQCGVKNFHLFGSVLCVVLCTHGQLQLIFGNEKAALLGGLWRTSG